MPPGTPRSNGRGLSPGHVVQGKSGKWYVLADKDVWRNVEHIRDLQRTGYKTMWITTRDGRRVRVVDHRRPIIIVTGPSSGSSQSARPGAVTILNKQAKGMPPSRYR